MRHRFGNVVVVALGGSILCPDGIDTAFIKKLGGFLRFFLKRRVKFVLVVGGGQLSRTYQKAAAKIARLTDNDKDWIGIHATRLNAHLLRTVLRDVADPVVIDEEKRIKRLAYPVTIAAGWRPGWSTDYVAVTLAKKFGAGETVIAGKPAHVYDRDNRTYKNAKPLPELSWRAYKKLIPAKWSPGAHAPVDPIAARRAEKEGTRAIVIDGRDLTNFRNLLSGKDFKGSIVG